MKGGFTFSPPVIHSLAEPVLRSVASRVNRGRQPNRKEELPGEAVEQWRVYLVDFSGPRCTRYKSLFRLPTQTAERHFGVGKYLRNDAEGIICHLWHFHLCYFCDVVDNTI